GGCMNRVVVPVAAMFALVAVASCKAVGAQERKPHQFSTTPPDGRYEIVGSPIAAQWTFRLDRMTGHVAMLVQTASGRTAWEDMEVENPVSVTPGGKPRFEIFSSGIAARWTLLIDTDSGRTWILVSGGDKAHPRPLWEPFEESGP